jgi:NADPH-dependent 2,4-dienoyl-CoA reductase/sulfur reductase-like enzyme/peroxiredoxin family protein/rhodanese-related sulfurtransferase/TusA-related sulfurtransferase
MKIVIVGGVAGGASAAARLRRLGEEHEILMLERGKYISFANCGLPYHIGGTIKERDNLLVQTVEGMKKRFNIDVRVRSEVTAIDVKDKSITVQDLEAQRSYTERYDKLLLSPGAEPVRPPIPGIDSDRILTLRNMSDMDRIIEKIEQTSARKAVVIGAGFIGLEIAENLHERGIAPAVVEKLDQVLAPVDREIAAQVHQHFKENHIGLYLGDGVTGFEEQDHAIEVSLESGTKLSSDIVILSIGVRPETRLAREAGLEIGERGGIKVDAYLKTSDEHIYAVGDAVEVTHLINGAQTLIPLAWPANRQGRIVADNMVGAHPKPYAGSMGTSILKVFDLTVAATGLNEKLLIAGGMDYHVVTVNRNSHAGYYPGALPFTLKLIFSSEGRIFGAQAIGYDGVDKRIDVIAAAIKGGLTVRELQELELAYAPPYNSAKDPVNIAGYTAENLLDGMFSQTRWYELERLLEDDRNVLVDVRTLDEYQLGTIPGAVHMELDTLRDSLDRLDKNKHYIVFCQVGHRGYLAARILAENGLSVSNLDGGYKLWLPTFLPQDNRQDLEELAASYGQKTGTSGSASEVHAESRSIELDACGLQCPGPILKTKKAMDGLSTGDILVVKATDPGFKKDVGVWAQKTGNTLLTVESSRGQVEARIRKGDAPLTGQPAVEKNRQTLVVFSGDLDKAIASMIIANGALAMGKEVSMFFTFWGLNILRKSGRVRVKKGMIDRMFASMMPKGVDELKLSKMHMAGMGTGMLKSVMKRKHVDSLKTLLDTFIDGGGKIIACSMSMDIMGLTEEELIDGIEYGGVATYLGDAQEAYSNLFI